ncbi:hypothetical protein PHK61_06270 [Actinomycetospora lutea]|uniref:hypothetical protein n=1 Tax=Actinomycetospora lutea TaxID=663604 RepID=UPI002365B031|nr:hypothetical protein [Actinomycetospora lutea]MDD7938022.1 hypothetical protein [Actinomycetospora lutea]
MSHTASRRAGAAPAVLTALRVTATLTVVVLLWQFVTAGGFVAQPGGDAAEAAHATGAIVLHVVAGLTMLAAAVLWRAGAALWPTVLAAVVFALTFVQAYVGSHGPLSVHIPGAMVLTVGAVVVAAWSFASTGSS